MERKAKDRRQSPDPWLALPMMTVGSSLVLFILSFSLIHELFYMGNLVVDQ